MNPLVFLALGGVALIALRKKPKGNGAEPEPEPEPDVDEDHVVEEGTLISAGGEPYDFQIWRVHEAAMPFLGELYADDGWLSGPLGPDQDTVRADLQVFADSLDENGGNVWQPGVHPCEGAEAGPFDLYQWDAAEQWVPTGQTIDPAEVLEPGRLWCVMGVAEGAWVGRVVDEESGQVMYESSVATDPHIAASMAIVGLYNPQGPFPWIGLQGN